MMQTQSKIPTIYDLAALLDREFNPDTDVVDLSRCQIATDLGRTPRSRELAIHFSQQPNRFTSMNLNYFKFDSNSRFKGKNLEDASMQHVCADEVDFEGVDFTRADLRYLQARNANWENAILERVRLDGADLRGAKGLTRLIERVYSCKFYIYPDDLKSADFTVEELCKLVQERNMKFLDPRDVPLEEPLDLSRQYPLLRDTALKAYLREKG